MKFKKRWFVNITANGLAMSSAEAKETFCFASDTEAKAFVLF